MVILKLVKAVYVDFFFFFKIIIWKCYMPVHVELNAKPIVPNACFLLLFFFNLKLIVRKKHKEAFVFNFKKIKYA